jgi:hypothetical protein
MTVETTHRPVSSLRARAAIVPAARWRLRPPSAEFVALLIVCIVGAWFIIPGVLWNSDTHLYLTVSIVDRASLNIDTFARLTGDIASANGHFYADKAPGLSLVAVPVYALIRALYMHGATYLGILGAPAGGPDATIVRYLLAVALSAIPTGLIAALIVWISRRIGASAGWSLALGLTYGLGTIARPFASLFFSHQFAACLVFSAFVILFRVRRRELDERWTILAGFLLGYAIVTENPTAIALLVLGAYALSAPTHGRRYFGLLALGVAPAALIYMAYNAAVFGSPLGLGYSHLAGPDVFRQGQGQGVFGVTYPHLNAVWQTTLGPYRGLFYLSPVLLLAIPGLVLLFRRPGWRPEALVSASISAGYLLFNFSYFAWDGGYSMGPRHVLVAVPFLVLPIAELLRPKRALGWRVVGAALGAYSIVVVEISAAISPLFDQRFASPLTQWVLPRLAGMYVDPQYPTGAIAGLPHAFAQAAPLFLSAHVEPNWGFYTRLPGFAQLWPLALIVAALLFWYARGARRTAGSQAMSGKSSGV